MGYSEPNLTDKCLDCGKTSTCQRKENPGEFVLIGISRSKYENNRSVKSNVRIDLSDFFIEFMSAKDISYLK